LTEELLPAVEKLQTADGRPIRISKDGNDRAIGGASSGAIAAFTAAWERPEAFSRVFSSIGTYVGLRGGNDYPTLVRKVEPKPIRVFLQDGSNDLNIYAGDWWMANQEMERAFVFAGYEVTHVWGEGGHNGEHATQVFPDAMRWLWKGWPERVKAGQGSRQLQDILIPGESWTLVGEGYQFTEGPIANATGEVFFNDVPNSKTYKVGLDGQVRPHNEDSQRANGMAFGPDGRLYTVATGTERILAYDSAGAVSVVAEGFRGNDIVARHDGSLYVTAPSRDPQVPSQVYYVSPRGEKKVVDSPAMTFPNGVTVSPDQSLLYVVDSRSHWGYSYQIQADGTLAHKQKYMHFHVPDSAEDSGADGMKADKDGRLYVATRMGIQVFDQLGRVQCIIPLPAPRVTNLCFGGAEGDTIFATCGDEVYKRKVKTRSARPDLAPTKPAPPRL
jgi:sugar lactone lactonase YvrE